MKTFICFAFFAMATAIPLKDSETIRVPDGPIPFEMLRNAAAFPMPVWRDLPINNLPEGDMYIAIVAVPNMDMPIDLGFNNVKDSDSQVKVVDAIAERPANEAGEDILGNAGVEVKDVYASVPSDNEVMSDNTFAMPGFPDDLRFVKFVNGPATFDLNNIEVPMFAHNRDMLRSLRFNNFKDNGNSVKVADTFAEILDNEAENISKNDGADNEVKVVYGLEPSEVISDDKLDVPKLLAPETNDLRVVKVVDGPVTFDLKNMHVPIDAHDIV